MSLTAADLAAVRARFGRRLPGSLWCGFASWEEVRTPGRPVRLALFTPVEGRRQLTLTRFDDGRFALRDEAGRTVASGTDIDALLAAVEHPLQ